MPGNRILDNQHFEFYLVGSWIFLHCYKCSWALFWGIVKLLANSFRQDWNKAQFRDSYSALWRQDPAHDPAENTLSSVLSVRRLSRWWLMGTGTTRACVSTCSLILLGGSRLALVVSSDPGIDQFIAEYLREALWVLASVRLTSPVSYLLRSYPSLPHF